MQISSFFHFHADVTGQRAQGAGSDDDFGSVIDAPAQAGKAESALSTIRAPLLVKADDPNPIQQGDGSEQNDPLVSQNLVFLHPSDAQTVLPHDPVGLGTSIGRDPVTDDADLLLTISDPGDLAQNPPASDRISISQTSQSGAESSGTHFVTSGFERQPAEPDASPRILPRGSAATETSDQSPESGQDRPGKTFQTEATPRIGNSMHHLPPEGFVVGRYLPALKNADVIAVPHDLNDHSVGKSPGESAEKGAAVADNQGPMSTLAHAVPLSSVGLPKLTPLQPSRIDQVDARASELVLVERVDPSLISSRTVPLLGKANPLGISDGTDSALATDGPLSEPLRNEGALAAAIQLKTGQGQKGSESAVRTVSQPIPQDTAPDVWPGIGRASDARGTWHAPFATAQDLGNAARPTNLPEPAIPVRADATSSSFDLFAPSNRDPTTFALTSLQPTLPLVHPGVALYPVAPHQLAQTIIQFVQKGPGGPVELTLRPDELGRMRFDMMTSGERVHVTLFVERPESMDLIRRFSDQLLQDLRLSGFSQPSLSFGDWSQRDSKPASTPSSPPEPEPTVPSVEATILHPNASAGVSAGRLDLRL